MRAPRLGEVLENVLGRLGLACARLSADDDRLVAFQRAHIAVRLVSCNSAHRRPFTPATLLSTLIDDGRVRI